MSIVFYMPPPGITGVWDGNDALPEFKEDVTVFKFERDGKQAAFSICPDITAQRAALAGLRRGWMSAVTQSETFAPASSHGVETDKPGVAELRADGNWVLREKAHVKFLD